MNLNAENVGEGWRPLIDKLDAAIREIMPDYKIAQIKEKFGGLRFYTYGPEGEVIDELITAAERKSYTICEFCGEPGEPRYDLSWVKTLCDKEYNERINR